MDCSTPEPQQHPTQQKACHWRRWYSVVYEAPLSTSSQALNTLEGGRHGWLYSFIRRALKLRKFERLVIGSLASHLWSWAWKTLLTLRAGFSLASQAHPGGLPLPRQRGSLLPSPELVPMTGCQPASHTILPAQMKRRMTYCHSKQTKPTDIHRLNQHKRPFFKNLYSAWLGIK